MAWAVDTCLLIDVAEADPIFGIGSAQLLDRLRPDGLVIKLCVNGLFQSPSSGY
jgi:hypothetical protein